MVPWRKLPQKNNFFPRKYSSHELSFPADDTGRCKVIAPKVEVANKITSGIGRENITVLAACNASGLKNVGVKSPRDRY